MTALVRKTVTAVVTNTAAHPKDNYTSSLDMFHPIITYVCHKLEEDSAPTPPPLAALKVCLC